MRIMKWLKLSAIVGVMPLIAASTCNGPELSGFEASLKEAEYIMYYPARANWGPNTVLAADVSGNRLKNVREVCTELYLFVEPKSYSVSLANYNSSSERDFSVAVNLLKGLLGPNLSGKLGIEAESKDTLAVTFSNTMEDSLTDTVQSTNEGQPRRIEPACEARLKQLKENGEFEDRVFIVLRAMRAGASYDFQATSKFKANAELSVTSVIGGEGSGGWNTTGKTTLTIDNTQYVGVARGGFVKLDKWLPSGEISGGYYKTNLSPIEIDGIDIAQ